jgi:dolichol-phosphate mannosyltransferase
MLETPWSNPLPDTVVSQVIPIRPVTKDDVTIVLPVLNEEEGIGMVLDEVISHGYRHILVVDGYSTDGTVEVAKSKGAEVIQQHSNGKTGAVRTAIDRVETRYMLVMDGDFTYDAGYIQRFLDHADSYDQIVGARPSTNISLVHRLGNWIITRVFNIMFDSAVSDVCSGMYLLKTQSARELDLHTGGFSTEVEVIAQMALHGTVTDVPIVYRARVGKQKLSTWRNGLQIMYSIFNVARIYNPILLFAVIAACAVIPGVAILLWVLAKWMLQGIFSTGWALLGAVLFIAGTQAFIVGTLALMIKRSETRLAKKLRHTAT